MKSSILINRILRNRFPVKFYYHFSLVNWTAATESATSYEHAHCAWYAMLIMPKMISFGIMKFGILLIDTHSAIVLLYHGYGNQYIIVKEKADAIYIRRI